VSVLVLVSVAAVTSAALAVVMIRRGRGIPDDLRALLSPEDAFELETRLRLVAVDEWMRAEAKLHHTAARLSMSRVPVGAIDVADADAVRIIFSDGTTLVVEHPDPFAISMIAQAAQAGRVMLRDVQGDPGQVLAHFEVHDGAVRLEATRMVVR
jgi:hypothetical protein